MTSGKDDDLLKGLDELGESTPVSKRKRDSLVTGEPSDLRRILSRLATWAEARPRVGTVAKQAYDALKSLSEVQRQEPHIAKAIAELDELLYDLGVIVRSSVSWENGELGLVHYRDPLY
jgi:hypothetical protein